MALSSWLRSCSVDWRATARMADALLRVSSSSPVRTDCTETVEASPDDALLCRRCAGRGANGGRGGCVSSCTSSPPLLDGSEAPAGALEASAQCLLLRVSASASAFKAACKERRTCTSSAPASDTIDAIEAEAEPPGGCIRAAMSGWTLSDIFMRTSDAICLKSASESWCTLSLMAAVRASSSSSPIEPAKGRASWPGKAKLTS
mmetsp:Transcript_36587/g.105178  ORF Transcript_36587/g.105178 Transcript_36587/m.105178 type:complete len:204 (-) Transcript_36587:1183-1794(-)